MPASGAIQGLKGDVKTKRLLVECKLTQKKQISVKKEWLQKIKEEAKRVAKIPALYIDVDGEGWVCVPKEVFQSIADGYEE